MEGTGEGGGGARRRKQSAPQRRVRAVSFAPEGQAGGDAEDDGLREEAQEVLSLIEGREPRRKPLKKRKREAANEAQGGEGEFGAGGRGGAKRRAGAEDERLAVPPRVSLSLLVPQAAAPPPTGAHADPGGLLLGTMLLVADEGSNDAVEEAMQAGGALVLLLRKREGGEWCELVSEAAGGAVSAEGPVKVAEELFAPLKKLQGDGAVKIVVSRNSGGASPRLDLVLAGAAVSDGASVAELEGEYAVKAHARALRAVMAVWLPLSLDSSHVPALGGAGNSGGSSLDVRALYRALGHMSEWGRAEGMEVRPGLRPRLREYQKEAVAWMVERETSADAAHRVVPHPLLTRCADARGTPFWYCEWSGAVTRAPATMRDAVRGGVLCDEMGLGKTVEVMQLVLENPMPPAEPGGDQGRAGNKRRRGQDDGDREGAGGGSEGAVEGEGDFGVGLAAAGLRIGSLAEASSDGDWWNVRILGVRRVPKQRDGAGCADGRQRGAGGSFAAAEGTHVDAGTGAGRAQEDGGEGQVEEVLVRWLGDEDGEEDQWVAVSTDSLRAPQGDWADKLLEDEEERARAAQKSSEFVHRQGEAAGLFGCCEGKYWKVRQDAQGGANDLRDVKATLIVCPTPILDQWRSEIDKHALPGTLRVATYGGLKHEGCARSLTLGEIALCDIVLTTYDALRSDVHHDGSAPRMLRTEKVYKVQKSPLLRVRWWRVCLDEAQMVESSTAKAAEMALKLVSVNRWCVTGTPVNKGLDDLYGLLLFLQASPYDFRSAWTDHLMKPYLAGSETAIQRAHAFLSRLLWRTGKDDVKGQIDIPNQTDLVQKHKFTPVEAHFYRKQHEECAEAALRLLQNRKNGRGQALNDQESQRMFTQLLKLRQACCHPQVGKSGIASVHKQVLSMEQILKQLLAHAVNECEEAQRLVVSALNGLAALSLINKDASGAIEKYRKVLTEIEAASAEGVKTDTLQQLHTLHNMGEVLRSEEGKALGKSCADASLEDRETRMRNRYCAAQTDNVIQFLDKYQQAAEEVEAKLRDNKDGNLWYLEACDLLSVGNGEHDALKRVESELMEAQGSRYSQQRKQQQGAETESLVGRFNSFAGLKLLLSREVERLFAARSKVDAVVRKLSKEPTDSDVNLCGNCGDCKANLNRTGPRCPHCRAQDDMDGYKNRLFHHTAERKKDKGRKEGEKLVPWWAERIEDEEGGGGGRRTQEKIIETGERKQSEVEVVLKTLLKLLDSSARAGSSAGVRRAADLRECGKRHVDVWDALKKEFDRVGHLWRSQRERLEKLDELGMATLRIRLRYDGETVEEGEELFKLWPGEVETVWAKVNADLVVATERNIVARGQLKYLRNLEHVKGRAEAGGEGGELCPVCSETIGAGHGELVVLPCGHMMCYTCTKTILKSHARRCPNCRRGFKEAEIAFVFEEEGEGSKAALTEVKGSYSTKVVSIVRGVLELPVGDKAIIFSEWDDMLELISKALEENDVKHIRCKGGKSVSQGVATFREDAESRVLLLPFKSGANGLNVTEATHVFLCEPTLNSGVEAQAIGRVHRIGQTRETVVHRLLISESVEEKVSEVARRRAQTALTSGGLEQKAKVVKHAEVVSLDDLGILFGDDAGEGGPGGGRGSHAQVEERGSGALSGGGQPGGVAWWEEEVLYEGRAVSRERAMRLLQCARSADVRSRGGGGETAGGEEYSTSVHGRLVDPGLEGPLLLLPLAAEGGM